MAKTKPKAKPQAKPNANKPKGAIITHDGEIRHARTRDAMQKEKGT